MALTPKLSGKLEQTPLIPSHSSFVLIFPYLQFFSPLPSLFPSFPPHLTARGSGSVEYWCTSNVQINNFVTAWMAYTATTAPNISIWVTNPLFWKCGRLLSHPIAGRRPWPDGGPVASRATSLLRWPVQLSDNLPARRSRVWETLILVISRGEWMLGGGRSSAIEWKGSQHSERHRDSSQLLWRPSAGCTADIRLFYPFACCRLQSRSAPHIGEFHATFIHQELVARRKAEKNEFRYLVTRYAYSVTSRALN